MTTTDLRTFVGGFAVAAAEALAVGSGSATATAALAASAAVSATIGADEAADPSNMFILRADGTVNSAGEVEPDRSPDSLQS